MKLMHERPLVYVAGPYTSPDPVRNTHDAIGWGDRITESGWGTAFVPHLTLLWHIVKPNDDIEHWYEFDLTIVRRSDALFRFPGRSSGADREIEFANAIGVPVFTDYDELLDFLRAHDLNK